ncbi:RHS repeat-associated core domain-containing protein [Chryseobacterium vrystaatense]|nr:RHS repeat-associated core domain-containing protein [Chryseobacterium vrystaatense]
MVEVNNCYAFGLLHNYTSTTQNAYQYKYNGKELQESGMYDDGARFYMPDLGRWGVLDPKSQYTHEAYSYVWNNPISFNDPTGMIGELFGNNGPGDPPVKTIEIEPIVITVYRPVKLEPRGVEFSSTAMLSGIVMTGSRYPSPYTLAAAGLAGIILWNTPEIYHATEAWKETEIIIKCWSKKIQ